MTSQGVIFDIQRFCLDDGPGIRTVLFLKGCPLSCKWCSNPESQSFKPEIMFFSNLCIGCRQCETVCNNAAISSTQSSLEIDRNRCVACGKCSRACPSNALRLAGQRCSAADVVEELLKDRLFFEVSGGGVTLSGGEPLSQPVFLTELLIELKKHGIHTAIETSGFADWNAFQKIIEYTDLFLFDIKHIDSCRHEAAVGVPNDRILSNLKSLAKKAKALFVRVPLIPGYNMDLEYLQKLVGYLDEIGVLRLDLLLYHCLGSKKYPALGRDYKLATLESPESSLIEAAAQELCRKTGLEVFVVLREVGGD